MELIRQFNAFALQSDGILSANARSLYYALLAIDNQRGWPEWFDASNRMLALKAGLGCERTLINTRNILKQKGFIDFIGGTKKVASRYKVIPLYCDMKVQTQVQPQVQVPVQTQVQPQVQVPVQVQVQPQVQNGDADEKTVTILRERAPAHRQDKTRKEETPPLTPQGEGRGESAPKSAGEDKAALFDKFWSEYPKKQGKKAACKSFLRIKSLASVFPAMMAALARQKQTTQWLKDDGRFIPLPATWLNGERWEDVEDVAIDQPRILGEGRFV